MEDVRKKIKEIREKKEISLRELSERTGISHSTLSRMETGQRKIPMEQLEKIANGLGVDIIELIDNKQKVQLDDEESWVIYGKSLEKEGITIDQVKEWVEFAKAVSKSKKNKT